MWTLFLFLFPYLLLSPFLALTLNIVSRRGRKPLERGGRRREETREEGRRLFLSFSLCFALSSSDPLTPLPSRQKAGMEGKQTHLVRNSPMESNPENAQARGKGTRQKRRIECKAAVKFIPGAEKCLPPADDTEGDVIMDEEEEDQATLHAGRASSQGWSGARECGDGDGFACVGTRRGG